MTLFKLLFINDGIHLFNLNKICFLRYLIAANINDMLPNSSDSDEEYLINEVSSSSRSPTYSREAANCTRCRNHGLELAL